MPCSRALKLSDSLQLLGIEPATLPGENTVYNVFFPRHNLSEKSQTKQNYDAT